MYLNVVYRYHVIAMVNFIHYSRKDWIVLNVIAICEYNELNCYVSLGNVFTPQIKCGQQQLCLLLCN